MGSAEEEALALKQKGNQAFAQHDWPTAIDYYTKAIELNPNDPSFYCNRAQVRLCLVVTAGFAGAFSKQPQIGRSYSHDRAFADTMRRPISSLRRMALQLLMRPRRLSWILIMSRCVHAVEVVCQRVSRTSNRPADWACYVFVGILPKSHRQYSDIAFTRCIERLQGRHQEGAARSRCEAQACRV